MKKFSALLLIIVVAATGCRNNPSAQVNLEESYAAFGADFPFIPPSDYNVQVPEYIGKDKLQGDTLDSRLATLGRILFYDKQLSDNNSIACASCHIQSYAFGDTANRSLGLNAGLTGRHSMRLVNARFEREEKMFWDERAASLETQVTMPIQDHVEMGFSGIDGQPDINDLIAKLEGIGYYQELFPYAFDGDAEISESRISSALSEFVYSIVSFDSKFDAGLANANSVADPFSNYTSTENLGKSLFLAPPDVDQNGMRIGRGFGCAGCHSPPEFDIDPASLNNGVFHKAGDPNGIDLTNTRAPSLRDLMGTSGLPNGPMMHTGDFIDFQTIIEHYDHIIQKAENTNLDNRLHRGPNDLLLNTTTEERLALEAFMKTLTGVNIYVDNRWSNPF